MVDCFAKVMRRVVGEVGAPCVLGLDPRPDRLPIDLLNHKDGVVAGIDTFHRLVLKMAVGKVPCVKPQIAFFEALGHAGYDLYQQTCRLAAEMGFLVIGDVKRGDIGSTATAYAQAHFENCHALTVNPYLGSDGVDPFLEWCRDQGKGVFILVRTSNPGNEFQPLKLVDGGTVADVVARAVTSWNEKMPFDDEGIYGPVGAVVGATHPEEIPHFRKLLPKSWLLLPGYGAQGAGAKDLAGAFDQQGFGGLVNSSRGITACFKPDDPEWKVKVHQALDDFHTDIRSAREV